jgi:hypothetical protein
MSLGEIMMKPTAMLYRNLLSLDLRRILTTTATTVAVPETPSTPIFAADLARPPLPEDRSICYQASNAVTRRHLERIGNLSKVTDHKMISEDLLSSDSYTRQ